MLRRSFYRGSFWAAAVGLPVALGWFLIDPKGDARQHITDRLVRVLDRARAPGSEETT